MSRPGKPDPRPEIRTEQPELIPELTSEMRPTDFDPNTRNNPTHNRTEPKIEHDPKSPIPEMTQPIWNPIHIDPTRIKPMVIYPNRTVSTFEPIQLLPDLFIPEHNPN